MARETRWVLGGIALLFIVLGVLLWGVVHAYHEMHKPVPAPSPTVVTVRPV